MSSLIHKKNKEKHLKGQVAAEPVTIKPIDVTSAKTVTIRVREDVREEINAIVKIKKHTSVSELLEELLELYKSEKLDAADRELIERLKN